MNAVELKRQLTIQDIESIVIHLGSNGVEHDSQGNPIFQTICHNGPGNGKYKLYYYDENQMFHCYSGCSDPTFDIYELVQRVGEAHDFIGAYQYVCNFFGYSPFGVSTDLEEPVSELIGDWTLFNKIALISQNTAPKNEGEKIIPKSMLNFFNPCIPYQWYKEGMSVEAMEKFGIRMDLGAEKIIIPHFDLEGNLIGIRGRSFNLDDLARGQKYMPVYIKDTADNSPPTLYNHPLGNHLYGLNFNRKAIERTKQVVIFEAEKSVILSSTYYGDNNYTVATCGSSISDTQVNLLLSLGVKEIVIAFDKENDEFPASEQTLAYRNKIESIARQFAPYVNTYYIFDIEGKLGYKDSPIDRGQETFEYLLKKKILVSSIANNEKNKRKK